MKMFGATATASLVNMWYVLSWHIKKIDSPPDNQTILYNNSNIVQQLHGESIVYPLLVQHVC
jgi:hypothetical protein